MKTAKLILVLILSIVTCGLSAQVSVNIDGSNPDSSAMLDVQSTSKGLLIPRMTESQRNIISNPVEGLMIYQMDEIVGFYYYTGTSWGLIGTGAFSIDDLGDGKTTGNSVYLGSGAGARDDGTDNRNVAVGDSALNQNIIGAYNTTYGYGADYHNQEGSSNTIVGFEAGKGASIHNKSGNVLLGYQAGYNVSENNKLYIENSDTSAPLIYGEFDNNILAVNGSLSVGTQSPNTSAKLEVESTTKGFLPPRMSMEQRDVISSPVAGLVVWCNNCGSDGELQVHNGTEWVNMTGGRAADTFTCGTSTVTDNDNNVYTTVLIGAQCWITENLKTTTFNDNSAIPNVTNHTTWSNLTVGAYAIYDNDESWSDIYGALYNLYAVLDSRGICPLGWHIPSDDEWTELTDYIGGTNPPNGNKLKSCRQVDSPLGGACNTTEQPRWEHSDYQYGTNDFGFTGIPGGSRDDAGTFLNIGSNGNWWTSSTDGVSRYLKYNYGNVTVNHRADKSGLSLRCIRD